MSLAEVVSLSIRHRLGSIVIQEGPARSLPDVTVIESAKLRLQDLDEAVRRFLAWKSILEEKQALNLDPHQEQQAETQKQAANGAVTARLPETYQSGSSR